MKITRENSKEKQIFSIANNFSWLFTNGKFHPMKKKKNCLIDKVLIDSRYGVSCMTTDVKQSTFTHKYL